MLFIQGGELTMMWGYGWGGWFLGALMMLLFWGGLVALVVFAMRSWGGGQRPGSQGPNARSILEERFARGEISKEEFEERRRVLERDAA
jgi:putative membrane protein